MPRALPFLLLLCAACRGAARDILTNPEFYLHQPLVACGSVTRVAANATPACCTLRASDCARRCTATFGCRAFAVAVYSDATPAGAPADGGAWQKCALFSAVDTTTCVSQLKFSRVRSFGAYVYDRTALDVWDTYFATLLPQAGTAPALPAEALLSGVAADAFAGAAARAALEVALQYALQEVCCASLVDVYDVRDAAVGGAARRRLAQQAGTPAVRVSLTVQPVSASGEFDAFTAAHVREALASPGAQALLLEQLRATGFPAAAGATFTWDGAAPAAPAPAAPRCVAEPPATLTALAVGLGAPLALALAALAALLSCCTLAPRGGSRRRAAAGRKHDVFLSYRRVDLQVVDAVHDKLALAGLRVFYDRNGAMAGRPFEQELFRAIRDAPVFSPVVTLEMMRALAAHRAESVDFVLAEAMLALHFARAGRVRLIAPLLVGEWCEGSAVSGGGVRDCLPFNEAFMAAQDALPAVSPTATLALVAGMFKAAGGGAVLDPALATASVRDLIVGAAAAEPPAMEEDGLPGAERGGDDDKPPPPPQVLDAAGRPRVVGLLEQNAVMLHGPDEQAGLVLRHRYAQRIASALNG
jgi:hypothetical protein